jgi:hypothetical protein
MFAQMERIYMLERAARARAAKQARGLPTGRPPKMTPQQRAAMAAMIAAGAVPEDVTAGFGISHACCATLKMPMSGALTVPTSLRANRTVSSARCRPKRTPSHTRLIGTLNAPSAPAISARIRVKQSLTWLRQRMTRLQRHGLLALADF